VGRGRTCGARVAGEGPDEDFETWRGAAATAVRPPSRRQEGETERGGEVRTLGWREGGREGGRDKREIPRADRGGSRVSVSAWKVAQNWAPFVIGSGLQSAFTTLLYPCGPTVW
jgi:hypothetical protein